MTARPALFEAGRAPREFFRRLFGAIGDDNIPFLASGIAFNILLAAIPFILLIITGFTYLLPRLTTTDPNLAAHQFIASFLPDTSGAGARFVSNLVDDVMRTRGAVTAVGGITFLIAAMRLFGSLRAALADVFDIERRRSTMNAIAFDLGMTLMSTLLFAASQVINAYLLMGTTRGLSVLSRLGLRSGMVGAVELWTGRATSFALVTLLFYVLFRLLPARRVRNRSALVAAGSAALMFEVAKQVFKLLFVRLNPTSLYTGSIAALVILVTWVYVGAMVFLIAGEIGQVYEQMRTRRLQTL